MSWNLASTNTVPAIKLNVDASGNGPVSGTITCGDDTYAVSGNWAASGSVPGRNASVFNITGNSPDPGPRFLAAAGIMVGPGGAPTQITLQIFIASSADGSLQYFGSVLSPA
jgi:hypothetical protein